MDRVEPSHKERFVVAPDNPAVYNARGEARVGRTLSRRTALAFASGSPESGRAMGAVSEAPAEATAGVLRPDEPDPEGASRGGRLDTASSRARWSPLR